MADRFLSLLDMTKRDSNDAAIGIVEEVNTVAPELTELMGAPLNGITYTATKRTSLPGGPVFRNANEGADVVSSVYETTTGSCFFLDGQMQIDEAVIKMGKAEGNSEAQVLADEASGLMQQKFIAVGNQFYLGTGADAKGFVGIKSMYDTTNCEVSAAGASGAATSAYLVWNDPSGLRWRWGNNKGLELGTWTRQQVKDGTGKAFFAWVNNLSGYLGLQMTHSRSVVRIKLITAAAPLTDALVADAVAKLPIFMRRSPNLRLLLNSQAELRLRKSRSTVSTAKTDSGILQFAPPASESNGIRIILTDSIPNNE